MVLTDDLLTPGEQTEILAYTGSGHGTSNLICPEYLKLLKNAAKCRAGREV